MVTASLIGVVPGGWPRPAAAQVGAAAPVPPALASQTAGGQPAAVPGAAENAAFSLSLPRAFELALAANRALAAARLARPVAVANVAVASERPNPDLLLEKLRETPREAVTLSLPVETAGKRGRRIAVAEADVSTGEAEIARTAATIRNQVRRAFYALLAAQRRAAEEEASLAIARRAADAARARFEAGAAPRLDALQTELAVAQTSNDAEGARGLLAAARSQLNTLVGRSPEAPVTAAGELASGAVPDAGAAVAGALAHSTELQVLDRRIAGQMAKAALARAQRVPNPVVQGAITHDSPPDFVWGWRAGLTVTLPIFTSHLPEVQVEEAALAQLEAERNASAAQIAGAVTAAAAQAAAAQRQALRFRDEIMPRALEVESLAEESYRAGQSGLVALLQVLQSTRDLRLRSIQTGLDYQTALAELEQSLGAPLP
jgi:cobalt-zinc-cadmium efflux system outer membrane protein